LVAIAGGVAAVVLIAAAVTAYALWPHPEPGPGPGGGSAGPHAPGAASPACGYKIAMLGVLSGDNNGDGTTIRDSAKLAVEQYNAKHTGCTVSLVEYDTQNAATGKDELAAAKAADIAADPRILGVVGPVYASEVRVALPPLESAGVPVITPSATDTDLSQNGWKVFHRTLGTDLDQADAGVRYLNRVIKVTKTFVVDDGTTFGSGVAAEVDRRLGDSSAGTGTIDLNKPDYSSVINQIKSSGADSVYFGGFSKAGGGFVKQLRAAKSDIVVMAGDRVFTDTFIDTAGQSNAEGVYITCTCVPPTEARNNFSTTYRNRFSDSAGYYGPEAFDAANILLSGIGAGKASRADMLAYVNAFDGEGVSRHVKFTVRGDLDVSRLQVWAYKVSSGTVRSVAVIPEA
jgi:branched-chain amino acid transport system substrate-binding protein